MAQIRRFPIFCHLRADPNQFILHFSGGRLKRHGRSLSFWFNPLAASIAEVPAASVG